MKPFPDIVSDDLLSLAIGRLVIDDAAGRNTARSKYLQFRVEPPPHRAPDLAQLGCRPFRHRSWDFAAYEEQLKVNNPFDEGWVPGSLYMPHYSIHSPELVERMHQELAEFDQPLRQQLERVQSESVRNDTIENWEVNLAAMQKTAKARRGVFAQPDY